MTGLGSLIFRNGKLFIKDKGMLFTALIAPIILLGLYATFLAGVYESIFVNFAPEYFAQSDKLLKPLVGAHIISSLLSVSSVTVAFGCNVIIVQDKTTGARRDLLITPLKKSTLALSYYLSSAIVSFLICVIAASICFIYLGFIGWYMSLVDVAMLMLDIVLLVLFGTALSSILYFFLTSDSQIAAVSAIISAGYGFLCGAYMPISQFGSGLQKTMMCLPGTYGTSLIRNHSFNGVLRELSKEFPEEFIKVIKDTIDCNIYFFGKDVSISTMYIVLGCAVLLITAVYVLMNLIKKKSFK